MRRLTSRSIKKETRCDNDLVDKHTPSVLRRVRPDDELDTAAGIGPGEQVKGSKWSFNRAKVNQTCKKLDQN